MSDHLLVEVDEVVQAGGSVWLFSGLEADDAEPGLPTGDRIIFAADHRMARDLADALEGGDQPFAAVPDWAVQRRTPA